MKSVKPIQIVDLFAGPGGLGEGFSSFDGGRGFDIIVSAEKDPVARKTLRLRAFFRLLKLKNPSALDDYYDYCNGRSSQAWSSRSELEWLESGNEARCITLGSVEGNTELDEILSERLDRTRPWVLIGGPPCQAYSLVGRARNRGNLEYRAEEDHRHFLYREYLRIIQRYKPAIFVMENVKGILSSKVGGKEIFPEILQDLADPDAALGVESSGRKYRICSLASDESYGPGDELGAVTSSNYIIRSEKNGVPQSRHRVILLGIAVDEAGEVPSFPKLDNDTSDITVADVLSSLPRLRSRLSREKDSPESWYLEVINQLDFLRSALESTGKDPLLRAELNIARSGIVGCSLDTGSLRYPRVKGDGKVHLAELDEWYQDRNLDVWLNHETRGHMPSDLRRYAYASVFAVAHKRSPKGHLEFDLPGLAPDHKNWESGKFSDRFRVQLKNAPSTTVTSHISKDGHYFIHYDPQQCRSLTVREAARLQTFPDNYFFEGNRTQQFHQVGNAVPPLLAAKIASVVAGVVKQGEWSFINPYEHQEGDDPNEAG
ncbi:DNA cytosine methyltransferase [Pseudomonas kulmbachensis]|uniref:DNA cytosine methyltransferase n=1 Tax=Pseudomonas kulmbachensis TaxID=3043408 RepID=UPI002AB14D12|nr:DNA cytosine methyltransferase [Pseudomonas sp. FLM 004-28]